MFAVTNDFLANHCTIIMVVEKSRQVGVSQTFSLYSLRHFKENTPLGHVHERTKKKDAECYTSLFLKIKQTWAVILCYDAA